MRKPWLTSALLSGLVAIGSAQAATLPADVWIGLLTLGPNDVFPQPLPKLSYGGTTTVGDFSFKYDDQGIWSTQLGEQGFQYTGRAFVFSSPDTSCFVEAYFEGWGDCPHLIGSYFGLPRDQFQTVLILRAATLVPEPALPWFALTGLGVVALAARRQRRGLATPPAQ